MASNEAPTTAPAAAAAAAGGNNKAGATDAARRPNTEPKKVHITDTQMTLANWHKHVNWLNVTLIVAIPIYGLVQAFWVPLQLKTALWAVAYYFMTGIGITAGMYP